MISMDSTVVAAEALVYTDLGGDIAMMDMEKGIYYGLNEIGGRVWHLIQSPQKVADLHQAILAEYDVSADVWEQDLLELLQEMAAESLIVVQNEFKGGAA